MKANFVKRHGALFPANEEARKLLNSMGDGELCEVEYKAGSRTLSQNAALHLWCEQVAQELNEHQLTCSNFFKEGHGVKFTKQIVKDEIWRPVQRAVTGEDSTRKPTKVQYGEIFDHVNGKLAEYGIHIEWPTERG